MQADTGLAIALRQSKYLNNIVEQDHRGIKRVTRPMLGFKTFRCPRITIAGIQTMDMIRKSRLGDIKDEPRRQRTSSTYLPSDLQVSPTFSPLTRYRGRTLIFALRCYRLNIKNDL